MAIKPINQKTFNDLVKLSDNKLDRRIEWLKHTGYCEAFELNGRLCYRVKITLSRNMATIKQFSTRSNSDNAKVLDILN